MAEPDFTLPDPQRVEFEQRYRGMRRPHFNGGDITACRPMTDLELKQYRRYRNNQDLAGVSEDEEPPF